MKVYRNKIPGDDTTKVVASRLTPTELRIKAEVDAQVKAVHELEVQLAKAQAALEQMQERCAHHAFRDEDGFPYAMRYCCVCGKFIGYV